MIKLSGVGRRFGYRWVLRRVDLTASEGECTVVFGANGAGKTTLLRIAAGLISPTEGELTWRGSRVTDESAWYRGKVGYVGHEPILYRDLSALENLRFYAGLYGLEVSTDRLRGLLSEVRLDLFRHDTPSSYSEGMRRRLALVRAVLHEPQILILDEPDAALDEAGQKLLDGWIRGYCEAGRLVFLATHRLELGIRRADRYVVLDTGKLLEQGSAAALNRAELAEALTQAGGSRW